MALALAFVLVVVLAVDLVVDLALVLVFAADLAGSFTDNRAIAWFLIHRM